MTPETFVGQLRRVLPTGVRSVVLYGSAVAGDHLGRRSDYNVLIVLERVGVAELKALSAPTKAWVKAGNHPPNVFTLEGLQKSAHAFPIELLDIRDAHRILFGDDVLPQINVCEGHLRTQIDHELKGKLVQLRAQFLLTEARPKQVVELMSATVSKFLILFRAVLRLYQKEVPAKKLDALQALGQHISFDRDAIVTIHEIKEGRKKPRDVQADALFERYLRAVETVTDAVDALREGANQ